MLHDMVSVVSACEKIVKNDQRIHEALKLGIVNNRRLARHIQEEVSNELGYNVNLATLGVTLKRISERTEKTHEARYKIILGQSRLQLRDDITILYMRGTQQQKNPDIGKRMGFYVRIEGIGSTTIFVDDEQEKRIQYKNEDLLKKLSNLTAIIISSPENIMDTPGVLAHIMMGLVGSQINVVEVISSYDSTYMIVEKNQSIKAIKSLRNMISRSRT